jgi:hypothetical protein
MKTLADFKKRIQTGVVVETYNHNLKRNFGQRQINLVQSNACTFLTSVEGKLVDSWLYYPKAKDIEFEGENIAYIYWGEGLKREKVLTLTFT